VFWKVQAFNDGGEVTESNQGLWFDVKIAQPPGEEAYRMIDGLVSSDLSSANRSAAAVTVSSPSSAGGIVFEQDTEDDGSFHLLIRFFYPQGVDPSPETEVIGLEVSKPGFRPQSLQIVSGSETVRPLSIPLVSTAPIVPAIIGPLLLK